MAVRFCLLGPVQAHVGDRRVDLGHARQRCVLAGLLVDANCIVSADQLIERVWGGGRLPDHPRGALQTYVSLLRRALRATRDLEIVRRADGYLISIEESSVDLHQFRQLARQARLADQANAVTLFERALALWSGEAFGTLDTPWLNDLRVALGEDRLAVERDLTDLQLQLGQHGMLLSRLSEWSDTQPLDERLAGQLMVALFRAGRQADALRHYEKVRRNLADELGADPGRTLRRLHQRILADDATLYLHPPFRVPTARPATTPRQLPTVPRTFTGRACELASISEADEAHGQSSGATTIVAISGAGGVGKTWLAVHWAHEHIDRFPDGQLFVNLRGFDPTGDPLSPQTALRGFLEALGVAPCAMPAGPDAQTGLYRSLLAGKRMLVVLDNARDADLVAPLLPGSASCTVLVTSRQRLGGLVASHGAHSLELDVLAEPEARQVLARFLGRDRVDAEPEAVAKMLACCAGLPLALGILAARALVRPGPSLTELADELRDAPARLEALDAGSPSANLRATLSCSYNALSPDTTGALGLLALAPGPDISTPAAAGLLGLSTARVRRLLSALEHASLLQQYTPGRHRMHDLVRLYASDRAKTDHTAAERDAAMRRLLDFYTDSACVADHLLDPHRPPIRLDPPAADLHRHEPPDGSAAMHWFQAEHANLLAAQRAAAAHAWHSTVWQLAWALSTFQLRRGLRHDELALWQAAAQAAPHLPDPTARTLAFRFLGRTHSELGEYPAALEHLRQALTLAEDHRDYAEQARSHAMLARVRERSGDYEQALAHALRAVDLYHTPNLYHAPDRPIWEANELNAAGWYAAHLGDYDTARTRCQAALALHRDHHNHDGEAATLDSLGYIELHCGNHQQAIELYRKSLALRRELGNTYYSADTLGRLGHLHAALGQHHQARTVWQEALKLYQAHQRDTDVEHIRQRLASLSP